MTIKLIPADYRTNWDTIENVIERAAPPTVQVNQTLLDNLQQSFIAGEMEALMLFNGNPMAIILTTIREDKILGKRELLIYAGAGMRPLSSDDWAQCYERVREYAKAYRCTHITALTKVPKVIKMAEILGGDVETRYISIPLGG